jgi:hypothetical protein
MDAPLFIGEEVVVHGKLAADGHHTDHSVLALLAMTDREVVRRYKLFRIAHRLLIH